MFFIVKNKTFCNLSIVLFGILIASIFFLPYFEEWLNDSETYDRSIIDQYQSAQEIYFEEYNEYGTKEDLGILIFHGETHNKMGMKIYDKINIYQIKKME